VHGSVVSLLLACPSRVLCRLYGVAPTPNGCWLMLLTLPTTVRDDNVYRYDTDSDGRKFVEKTDLRDI
jgi:hypothetical protein